MPSNPAPGFLKKPDHEVVVSMFNGRVTVDLAGERVADSRAALLVEETRHRAVYYIPATDVRMDLAQAGDAESYCPFKGHASYHSFTVGEVSAPNAAWSYDAPYDEAVALKDYLAFYADRVDAITAS